MRPAERQTRWFKVPRSDSPDFKGALTKIVESEGVRVVVPTNDLDLIPLSELAAPLSASGVWAIVGDPTAVRTARDKKTTSDFLHKIGLPCPWTELAAHTDPALNAHDVVAKPRDGSASVGVFYPENQRWIRNYRFADYVVQKYVDGMEVTTNVYLSGYGEVHSVVSHSRLEVRSGEVSKAVTINEPALVEYARVIAKNLALLGPFSFQAIVPDQGKPQIIEINARFGAADTRLRIRRERISHAISSSRLSGANLRPAAHARWDWSCSGTTQPFMSSPNGPVVVFDLDDTVFSERQYAVSGFKATGHFIQRQFGIRGFAETSIALFESASSRQRVRQSLRRTETSHL